MSVTPIYTRVRRRLGNRMREAFTFLVATAWLELFNGIFEIIAGDSTHILMSLFHAITFTILAVIVTVLFDDDTEEGHED